MGPLGENWWLPENMIIGRLLGPDLVFLRGIAFYMAPKCLIESVKEPPSDIWGLGCIVCEMLTGKSPWDRVRVGQTRSV